MDPVLILTIGIIAVALIFDFINGFHDAANATATIVATKVLTPRKAVLWAASFNFIALFVFGTGVAKTVGSGLIDLQYITQPVILAGLLGAIVWNLLTWWYKMPSSSSHALLGGYAGSAMTYSVLNHGWSNLLTPLLWSGWNKTLLFIVVAPVLGYLLAFIILRIAQRLLPVDANQPAPSCSPHYNWLLPPC